MIDRSRMRNRGFINPSCLVVLCRGRAIQRSRAGEYKASDPSLDGHSSKSFCGGHVHRLECLLTQVFYVRRVYCSNVNHSINPVQRRSKSRGFRDRSHYVSC